MVAVRPDAALAFAVVGFSACRTIMIIEVRAWREATGVSLYTATRAGRIERGPTERPGSSSAATVRSKAASAVGVISAASIVRASNAAPTAGATAVPPRPTSSRSSPAAIAVKASRSRCVRAVAAHASASDPQRVQLHQQRHVRARRVARVGQRAERRSLPGQRARYVVDLVRDILQGHLAHARDIRPLTGSAAAQAALDTLRPWPSTESTSARRTPPSPASARTDDRRCSPGCPEPRPPRRSCCSRARRSTSSARARAARPASTPSTCAHSSNAGWATPSGGSWRTARPGRRPRCRR